MPTTGDSLVRVHESWKGWRSAQVRVRDVEDVRWVQPRGAPHPLIHGYVACTRLVNGELRHECDPAFRPCYVLVCVLKHHNVLTSYAALARCADSGEAGATRHAYSGDITRPASDLDADSAAVEGSGNDRPAGDRQPGERPRQPFVARAPG
jgi:hypothetical protein